MEDRRWEVIYADRPEQEVDITPESKLVLQLSIHDEALNYAEESDFKDRSGYKEELVKHLNQVGADLCAISMGSRDARCRVCEGKLHL